ncbi:transposase domain-containing protein [Solemya pervernicosa gill symbiont]|nr:transposase domain-containing protein [Solemya pervernicosa gill symbiont]
MELAGMSGMPETKSAVIRRAKKGEWQDRKRAGRGGGKEYHISALPTETQAALLIQQQPKEAAPASTPKRDEIHHYSREGLWENYEAKPAKQKQQAEDRLAAINAALTLIETGTKKSEAWKQAAEQSGMSKATLYRHYSKVTHYDRSDWLAALVSGYTGRTATASCDNDAWDFFKTDYLRLEQPAAACYDRLSRAAQEEGWSIPGLRTLERRIEREIPLTLRVLMREGEHALMRMYPAQQRHVQDLHAMQWINGDGYQHNVFVMWPDGTIGRPKTWFWQDIYSRKILAYRTDQTEHTDMLRLAFGDMIENYGIPDDATIDNTRAAANKWMTGGVANRYRFKVKEDDPLGIMPTLGIKVHWTSVLNGKGHGQAKPIERAFGVGGLGEYIDKHPSLSGAYTGENPMAKPESYGSKAIPLATFLAILDKEIPAWNAKPLRRTELCGGVKSYDQVFNESYEKATIRKATEEQRRLWLLSAEAIKVGNDGTIILDAGAASGIGKNRYHSDTLYEFQGKKIVVRFDPDKLHDNVHLYTLDSRYIGEAKCIDATGFGDTSAAREHKRQRTAMIKATKIAAKAEQRMDSVELNNLVPTTNTPLPKPGSVRMFMPTTHQQRTPQKRALTPEELAIAAQLQETPAEVRELPQTPRQRYQRWAELDAAITAGEEINEQDRTWHERCQSTNEWSAEHTVHQEFGLSIAQ